MGRLAPREKGDIPASEVSKELSDSLDRLDLQDKEASCHSFVIPIMDVSSDSAHKFHLPNASCCLLSNMHFSMLVKQLHGAIG